MVRLILAAASIAVLAVPAAAERCRDVKGRYIKCTQKVRVVPVVVVKDKGMRCHDTRGRFIKCKV